MSNTTPSREEVLERISNISEFMEMHEEFDDDNLDLALYRVIELIAEPNISPSKAAFYITQLQAISAKMGILGTYYTVLDTGKVGTPQNKRKNMFKTTNDEINRLVDALKYIARMGS